MPPRKRGRRTYPTDLTDTQWALIAPLIPEAEPGGRPRKASSRELVKQVRESSRSSTANGSGDRQARQRRSWTANLCERLIKKGIEGL